MSIPGVSVLERSSGAIEIVHEPTAVPLFVGKFAKQANGPEDGQLVQIESVADLNAKFKPVTVEATVSADQGAVSEVSVTSGMGHLSVLHYFANGGGSCYVMPSASLTSANLPTELEQVTGYPDISLLVYTETADLPRKLSVDGAVGALAAFAASHSGYFVLGANVPKSDILDNAKPHVALYCPLIKIDPLIASVADDDVALKSDPANTLGTSGQAAASLSQVNDSGVQANIRANVQAHLAEKLADLQFSPAPAIAGLIAATDRTYGPWRAPANLPIAGVTQLCWASGDSFETLFGGGFNLIRPYEGQPAVVMGARTCADDVDIVNRYVQVRRLLDMIERDLKGSLGTLTFRANDEHTWELARGAVENYLRPLWRQQALVGESEAEAFYVRCGLGVTMTQDDIGNGKMVVKIGVAPVRPAEFVEIDFAQLLG